MKTLLSQLEKKKSILNAMIPMENDIVG